MGAFAFREAARRGLSVAGIEQYDSVGHEFGASGGQTRIFRLAYKEGSAYLPLLTESLRAWEDMQADASDTIWQRNGALMIGSPDHPEMRVYTESVRNGGLDVTRISHTECEQIWPQHRLLDSDIVYYDPNGGLLRPDSAIRKAVSDGLACGGQLLTSTRIRAFSEHAGRYRIEPEAGPAITARRLLLAAGPWATELAPALADALDLLVVTLHWYPVDQQSLFGVERFPVGMRRSGGDLDFSFFPAVDTMGIKVNFHVPKEKIDSMVDAPDSVPVAYSERVSPGITTAFNGVSATWSGARSFIDTYTEDKQPIFARLDSTGRGWAIAGFSGQGFKMAPAFARHIIDLIEGEPADPLRSLPIHLV